MKKITLASARKKDLDQAIKMVRSFREYEGKKQSYDSIQTALFPLLKKGSDLGCFWFIEKDGNVIGYVALCFGYSLEFGGRDAFIDELFLREDCRGQGIGQYVIDLVTKEASRLGVLALHLEVNPKEKNVVNFYKKAKFELRSAYQLMTNQIRK